MIGAASSTSCSTSPSSSTCITAFTVRDLPIPHSPFVVEEDIICLCHQKVLCLPTGLAGADTVDESVNYGQLLINTRAILHKADEAQAATNQIAPKFSFIFPASPCSPTKLTYQALLLSYNHHAYYDDYQRTAYTLLHVPHSC